MHHINYKKESSELVIANQSIRPSKGQLFSERIYEVIVSPKMRTKNCQDFCPVNFLFVFWEKR